MTDHTGTSPAGALQLQLTLDQAEHLFDALDAAIYEVALPTWRRHGVVYEPTTVVQLDDEAVQALASIHEYREIEALLRRAVRASRPPQPRATVHDRTRLARRLTLEYRVRWEIDVDADTPEDAANLVLNEFLSPSIESTLVEVVAGKQTHVLETDGHSRVADTLYRVCACCGRLVEASIEFCPFDGRNL